MTLQAFINFNKAKDVKSSDQIKEIEKMKSYLSVAMLRYKPNKIGSQTKNRLMDGLAGLIGEYGNKRAANKQAAEKVGKTWLEAIHVDVIPKNPAPRNNAQTRKSQEREQSIE